MDMGIANANKIADLGHPSMWIEWGNLARQNNACNLGNEDVLY